MAVHYLGVHDVCEIIAIDGPARVFRDVVAKLDADFRRWERFERVSRLASHSPQGVIELMPTSDGERYAFKYVNGHPANTGLGLFTVTAFGVLSDVATGYPTLISEMTLATAIRTAATSALAARVLARAGSRSMALVGLGAQAEFQALAFQAVLGIDRLVIYDIDPGAIAKLRRNLEGSGLTILDAACVAEAVRGVDIITTATATKASRVVLADATVEPGQHINAIGGDCPGKTELDPAILRRARVFVEHLPQTRVEGEIQLLGPEVGATELWRVLRDEAPGRTSRTDVTVFDSVGFAVEDFATMTWLAERSTALGLGRTLDLVPELGDPKDLYGLVLRHGYAARGSIMGRVA